MSYTAQDIAKLVGGELIGNSSKQITNVAKIEEANSTDLCFISNKKYIHYLSETQAGAVIIGKDVSDIPNGQTVIKCDMPYVSFCQVLIELFDYKDPNTGIDNSASIDPSAQIGKDVYIGPHAYIGKNVKIGDHSKVYANASIYEDCSIGKNSRVYANVSIYYNCHIGDSCIVHSGTVIGSDGFGHAPLPDGTYIKIPQIGNVVIKNNVEIGANCSIDRANMGSTLIEEGCRIDNLIQIAHGVEIGKHTVVAAQTGISGSSKIGKHCIIAGQVGITGHISIADKVQIGAQSGVSNTIKEEGGKFTDTPHLPLSKSVRSRVIYKNLPDIEQRLRAVEKEINKSE